MNQDQWIVFWAAFGGGAAAGLFTLVAILLSDYLQRRRERPLLKVKLSAGWFVGPGKYLTTVVKNDHPYLFFEAHNVYRAPVTVDSFGLLYRDKHSGKLQVKPRLGYAFPYRIEGGQSLIQWTERAELFRTLKRDGCSPSDLKWVWFKASTGQVYKDRISKDIMVSLSAAFNKADQGAEDTQAG